MPDITPNVPPTASKEDVVYAPTHLERIRELYASGSPITLPAQLESERADLDARRATFQKSQGEPSTAAGAGASLRPTTASSIGSSSVGSTAAPSSAAGTAGSSTGAR